MRSVRTRVLLLTSLVALLALMLGLECRPGQSEPNQPKSGAPTAAREAVPEPGVDAAAPAPAMSPETLQALGEFNRAAASLEQYQYLDAAKGFENVLKLAPGWEAARFNLGLSYLNLQGVQGAETYLDSAQQIFEALLKERPENAHAHFALGMLHKHQGNSDRALEHFEAVYQADPGDLFGAYKYAESLIDVGRHEEGARLLETVVERNPGFSSAVYRLAMQYQRLRQREKAIPLIERFKALNSTELSPAVFAVDQTYGAAGKYYLALDADNLPLPAARTEARPIVFSPETVVLEAATQSWTGQSEPAGGGGPSTISIPGLAADDVDGDGDFDLCLTALDDQGRTALWINDGQGQFSAGADVAKGGIAPALGDLDNDGDLDLWLGRLGADTLFMNDGDGNFTPAEVSPALAEGLVATSARLVDIDSDGDLDLVACHVAHGSVPADEKASSASIVIYSNNRDGSYTDVVERLGLAEPLVPAMVVYDDFDNDRDLDLIILPAGKSPPLVWINDRAWQYRLAKPEEIGLDVQSAFSAVTGDPDKDGDRDLLVFARDGLSLYLNDGRFNFQKDEEFSRQFGMLGGTGGQFADLDNDGDLDIVIADATRPGGSRGPAVLVNLDPERGFVNASQLDRGNLLDAINTDGNASCVVADFTGDGRCDILVAAIGQKPVLVRNATPGGHWLGLRLAGTQPQDKKSRSNNSAIGSRVEVKTGRVFQQYLVGGASGAVAAPPLQVHAGLGDQKQVDWLRILWPDGVLQAEMEVPADQVTKIEELQRRISSCPHLFVWNGSRFEFVSDFGGVGGLGYMVAPGVYAQPDPTEYVPIPRLEPRDGQYVLQVIEPLEEVVYLDEARLIAVDHPQGTEIFPQEMAAVGAAPPEFELFCFRQSIEPIRAVDHQGTDVTDAVREIDRQYAGAVELDKRFVGYAKDHFVELDFGDRLARFAPDDRLVLLLHGWVEYSYSSTNFAASQAGLRLKAPSVEVFRNDHWVELFHEVGYPAGLQHVMTLDVTGKLLPGDRRIRISSNMDLYWDRIGLARHESGERLTLSELAPSSADLHYLGYPREYSPDGRQPNLLDYSNLDRAVAWQLMAGDYTRFGDVTRLVEETDDCYVIMGRGEEVTLRFNADALGPVPVGCRRSFLLKTDSYCKDMDLYTAHPDTVEPLPFHGMSSYPYPPGERYPDNELTREYRSEYNTRRVK